MKKLKEQISQLLNIASAASQNIELITDGKAVYPFSDESRLLAYLLSTGTITYDEYCQIATEYSERNKYLDLFDLAPRTFGQTWGEMYIRDLFPEFIKATKENVSAQYPDFDGEFDLLLDRIRIEVKACRANSTETGGSLASRAYLHSEATAASFKYHFQQLKPSCCDVFIWIGVCRDDLIYWVLSSKELRATGKLGSQHRNERTGMADTEVFEGQVFMTEEELYPFLVSEDDILNAVRRKAENNM